jgi:hypothetical protein
MRMIFVVLLAANVIFFVSQILGNHKPAEARRPSVVAGQRINGLQTLAERDAKEKTPKKEQIKKESLRKESSKKENKSAAISSVATNAGQCQLIGPFVELVHAEYVVERLSGFEIESVIKNVEIIDGKSYWVYLKPEMSEKEALRRLYEIQAKSIDSYIIPSGELANGISFGQFSDIKTAQRKSEKIRGEGYAVDIKEVPKSHSEVWVEMDGKYERKLSDGQWLDILKEEKGIERRLNYCLGVARP